MEFRPLVEGSYCRFIVDHIALRWLSTHEDATVSSDIAHEKALHYVANGELENRRRRGVVV